MSDETSHFPCNQYFAAILANIVGIGQGCMLGWASPALRILVTENTPLKSGPLTNEQLSWLGSVNGLSAIFGSVIFGCTVAVVGSKRTLLILALPSSIFWILIYFGDTHYHILIARCLNGLVAGGANSVTILYIADIANNNIRGRLSSFSQLSRNIGILIAYILGAFLQYKVIPCIFILVPIVFLFSFTLLPNTPQYNLRRGQLQEAKESLEFYKTGCKGKTNWDEAFAIDAEFDRLKTIANEQKIGEQVRLKDIFINRKALKGLANGIILANLSHLTGHLVFITYAALILDRVGATHIDPSISSISLAVLQLIGSICTARFSDTLGRKTLLIISFVGSAMGMISFTIYSYLKHNGHELSAFEWVPIASLSIVIFAASTGAVPLVSVCIVENIPSKIRTLGLTICGIFMNIASFYCLMLFPILNASFQLHGCILFYAVACILGTIYIIFSLEETKGKDLDTDTGNNNALPSSSSKL